MDEVSEVDMVQEAFRARFEVGLQLRAELSDGDLSRERARVRRQILRCTKCALHEHVTTPVPISGPKAGGQAQVLCVGEGPGEKEDERGEPFVGPAGKLLRALLSEAGFDLDGVAWCNTVSCWPRREAPPNMEEMRACRGNLRDQVVASGATYVLLVGGVATSAWRSDMRVSDVHGQVFLWGRVWVVMPIYHPAAILRDITKRAPTQRDLAYWYRVVNEGQSVGALGLHCVKCKDWVSHYDPDGVPWCERHWGRFGGAWKKEWERWSNDKAIGNEGLRMAEGQGTLFGT